MAELPQEFSFTLTFIFKVQMRFISSTENNKISYQEINSP